MQYINKETNQKLSHEQLQNKLNKSFPRRSPPEPWEIYRKPVVEISNAERIKRQRDAIMYSGVDFNGYRIDTGDKTQTRLLAVVLAAQFDPVNYKVTWKTEDGQFIELTAPEIIQMAQTVREHIQGCFDRESVLRAIDASPEELTMEEIYSGWPGQIVEEVIEGDPDVT